MEELTIEPVGGFTGAGGPGHVRSEGRLNLSALSPDDRARVEAMFARSPPAQGNFGYRITRQGPTGPQSVLVPSDAVPAALIAAIQTRLD